MGGPDQHLSRLLDAERRGSLPHFLFFWGHTAPAPDAVGPHCLSQWWPAPFEVDGVTYATAEHWMMAAKARLFGDDDALAQILASHTPKDAKAGGRAVRGYDDEAWKRARFELVVEGNLAKFSQDAALARYLYSTGTLVLVEAAPRDTVWGIGLGRDNPRARKPSQWRGTNLLGFALMEVRARLAATS